MSVHAQVVHQHAYELCTLRPRPMHTLHTRAPPAPRGIRQPNTTNTDTYATHPLTSHVRAPAVSRPQHHPRDVHRLDCQIRGRSQLSLTAIPCRVHRILGTLRCGNLKGDASQARPGYRMQTEQSLLGGPHRRLGCSRNAKQRNYFCGALSSVTQPTRLACHAADMSAV